MEKRFLLLGLFLSSALLLGGCIQPRDCVGEGEQFSDTLDCCQGLAKVVNICGRGCGEIWETIVDANRTFSSKEEVLDFLANEMSEEYMVGPAEEYAWHKDRVNQISIDTKNGKFNKDDLRLIDYTQAKAEYWKATHCAINLTYEEATPKVYYITKERWFVTEDGRLIVYFGTGA